MFTRVGAIVALAVCVGCGKPARPPSAATAVQPAAPEPEPPPDLSPVAAPEDLVLVGRIARPRVLFETLASWSGAPVRVTDLLPSEARELGAVVAWDAPVEVAAVLDRNSTAKMPEPVAVLSIGLTSVEAAIELARKNGVNATAVAPGIARLAIDDDVSCAAAVAVGSAPARLVCGEDWDDVQALLPYATRGLPRANLGTSDLHVELRAAPIQRRYAQELGAIRLVAGLLLRNAQTDSKRLDRALTDAVYGLADELRALATELERVEIHARLDEAKKQLEIGYALALSNSNSAFAQICKDSGRRAAPPPETFWQLPSAADGASYMVASDPKRMEQLFLTLAELTDAYLEQQKVGAPLRKRVRTLVESYVAGFWVPAVSAYGPPADAAQPSLPGNFLHRGWSVSIAEARADKITKPLAQLAGIAADRELAKLLKARFSMDPKLMPKVRTSAPRVRGFTARGSLYAVEFSKQFLDFVSDQVDRSNEPAPKPAEPKTAAKKAPPPGFVFLVVPDGERSWIAYAPDEKTAVQKLEAARDGKEPKLANVAELQHLRNDRAVLAGYWTVAGILSSVASYAQREGTDVEALLARMPHHGRSLALFDSKVVENGPGVTLTASTRIPQAAFQDAAMIGIEVLPKLGALVGSSSDRSQVAEIKR